MALSLSLLGLAMAAFVRGEDAPPPAETTSWQLASPVTLAGPLSPLVDPFEGGDPRLRPLVDPFADGMACVVDVDAPLINPFDSQRDQPLDPDAR